MARKATKKSKNLCPLTTDKDLRAAADKQTTQIKAQFPPGISQPALRALAAAGYTALNLLTKTTEVDLLELHGMGPKAISILREALRSRGKAFRK